LLPGPVVRVDRDLEMLRAAGPGPRAQATLARLPFADGSFAGALCMRLLQHLPRRDERRAMLAELSRVTRGPLLVSFFDRHSLQHLRRRLRARFGGRASARVAIAAAELREDLAACGRRIVAIESLRRWISEQRIALALPG
jgi:ubiquinone/menaquinone biosynthesis C-methylase UbiE